MSILVMVTEIREKSNQPGTYPFTVFNPDQQRRPPPPKNMHLESLVTNSVRETSVKETTPPSPRMEIKNETKHFTNSPPELKEIVKFESGPILGHFCEEDR